MCSRMSKISSYHHSIRKMYHHFNICGRCGFVGSHDLLKYVFFQHWEMYIADCVNRILLVFTMATNSNWKLKSPSTPKHVIFSSSCSWSWMFELHCAEWYMCRVWTLEGCFHIHLVKVSLCSLNILIWRGRPTSMICDIRNSFLVQYSIYTSVM